MKQASPNRTQKKESLSGKGLLVVYVENTNTFNKKTEYFREMSDIIASTANKYYFSAGHHEQKNKKPTGQIKFLVVTIKHLNKNQSYNILYVNKCECTSSIVPIAQFHLQYFLYSQITQQYIITSFNKESKFASCVVTVNDEHMKPRVTKKAQGLNIQRVYAPIFLKL